MKPIIYREIDNQKGFWVVFSMSGLLIVFGALAFFYMEHFGHVVTGMNNQVVWGMPHVLAIFLIISASGALNIASISSVFMKKAYKPLNRMSGFLALSLLTGGLTILLLDLGRPDRLIVAITQYNFKSIFAWNIYLYTGFFAIVLIYLWTIMEPSAERFTRIVGTLAFIWRLLLTMGTGSIFGFLVARQAYDAAILAPMFIVMSFAFGKSVFLLLLMGVFHINKRPLNPDLLTRMRYLFGIFIAAILFFVIIYNITNLYATEHHGIQTFIMMNGEHYTILFWFGQIFIGSILPLVLIYMPNLRQNSRSLVVAAILVIIGGLSQLYVLVVGGQAYPLVLFPNSDVSSNFSDGVVSSYIPSMPEIILGLGGVGVAIGLFLLACKILPIVPENLSKTFTDSHYKD